MAASKKSASHEKELKATVKKLRSKLEKAEANSKWWRKESGRQRGGVGSRGKTSEEALQAVGEGYSPGKVRQARRRRDGTSRGDAHTDRRLEGMVLRCL